MTQGRRRVELPQEECLRLLGEVGFGRVIFTLRALPAVMPVTHLVEPGRVIIRAGLGAGISSAAGGGSGTVVGYEADAIDPAERLGWCIVVIGRATVVRDRADAARYRRALRPWTTAEPDEVIAIRTDLVTGFRLVAVPEPASAAGTAAHTGADSHGPDVSAAASSRATGTTPAESP